MHVHICDLDSFAFNEVTQVAQECSHQRGLGPMDILPHSCPHFTQAPSPVLVFVQHCAQTTL